MKERLLVFIQNHYRRFHDVIFYVLMLAVIVLCTYFAVRITQQNKQKEETFLITRQIPSEQFVIKDKPIYVALQEAGLDVQMITQIVSKLSSVVDTRKLQPKDTYSLSVADNQFVLLVLMQGLKRFYVANVQGALVAGVSEVEVKTRIKTAAGKVQNSLYGSMLKDGLRDGLVMDFTDAFSWTIDFNSDTRNGDEYTALWEEHYTDTGNITSQDLLAAAYTSRFVGNTTYALYFDGEFYDENGKISKKMFLKSPISFRNYRISSHFSYGRMHPILKTRRPHLGIDYAAPTGTPVQSVADGRVTFVGRKGGFGNFVEIKHANNFTTTYGHLSKYGAGIKAGVHVKQGQTVGYVGATGLATGPHLDFRIREGNKFLDFLRMRNRNSAVRDLSGDKRKEFDELKVLYLKELNAAKQADEDLSSNATEETHAA